MADLFGRRKMYKKGMEDALRANAAFAEKQREAIAEMREEVRKNRMSIEAGLQMALHRLDGNIIGLQKYLDAREREALYKISTPADIRSMGNEEKHLLIAILYQLATEEGDKLTAYQRVFIRSVQKYLGISNPQTYADLSVVGDIDSIECQRSILSVVMEFLYLQDGEELSETQEEFLGYFSVNRKHAGLIEEQVSQLYSIVGPEGIAEKYGFDPTQFEEPTTTQAGPSREVLEKEWAALEQVMEQITERILVSPTLAWDFPDYEIVGEDFYSKSSARSAAERELNKLYDAQNQMFSPYSSSSVAIRAADGITRQVESVFEGLVKQIREFGRNTLCTQAAQQMEDLLDYKAFIETIKKLFREELQSNSYKYKLSDFSCYSCRIELDSDDFEMETGFFARLLEKASVKWTYYLSEASNEITDDLFSLQKTFASDATEIVRRELRTNLFSKMRTVYTDLLKW